MKGVKCESQDVTPDKKLYPYASSQQLPVKGSFKCVVMCEHETGKPSNHAKTISNSHS